MGLTPVPRSTNQLRSWTGKHRKPIPLWNALYPGGRVEGVTMPERALVSFYGMHGPAHDSQYLV